MVLGFIFNSKKEGSQRRKILPAAALIWQKNYKIVFFLCLASAFIFGWHVWRKSLSENYWSAEKKQEYLNKQDTGVIFNQKKFEKASEDIEVRRQASNEEQGVLRDIFKSY